MKIERIKITVTEPVTLNRTQAHIMQYDMSRDSYPIYMLGEREPRYMYQNRYGPTLDIKFLCPKCTAEFEVKITRWSYEEGIDMTCVCGLPLHILPVSDEYYNERPRFL